MSFNATADIHLGPISLVNSISLPSRMRMKYKAWGILWWMRVMHLGIILRCSHVDRWVLILSIVVRCSLGAVTHCPDVVGIEGGGQEALSFSMGSTVR